MADDLRISAVIPTYNRGHLVARAIESALAQEFAPSEIIVVDDGSVDNTRAIIQSYGQAVRYAYQANAGVSAARNLGVREANYEWIAFLDSDDYWLPGHLSRVARAIYETHGAAALYFADLRVPHGEGGHRHWQTCGFEIEGEWEFKRDASGWAFMKIQPMMLQASVLSRHAYIEVGGLPEYLRTREDTFLFFKLGLLYPECAVSRCGTVRNYDSNIRLTQVHSSESLVFHDATIYLYRKLACLKSISREHRETLIEALSVSYFDMARTLLRQQNYLRVIKTLATACSVSPSRFVKEVFRLWGRHRPFISWFRREFYWRRAQ